MSAKRFLLLFCSVILVASCSKNEHDAGFGAKARIFFASYLSSDSLVHSFANYPAVEYKELSLPLRIMGEIENYDRTVQVTVDPASTTAVDGEYEIGQQITVPAGSVTGRLPLTIKVSPRLETQQVELTLRLQPSSDFEAEPEKPGKLNELVKFRVIWSNILVKPSDWPTTLWGGYSKVKHRLVIDLSGVSQYSGTLWTTTGQAYQIMGVCNEWLLAYNTAHPDAPYLDENGKQIRFCPTCN